MGALDAANFVAPAPNVPSAACGTPQFIYNTAVGALFFDPDGAGGAGRVRLANLDGAPTLTAADVVIV
ncbi:MAG TPA: hypothetical protein VGN83_23495 [Falsiroseomonas sp.]|jgi:Ca2+-binding RTX toxin-like protein|nr:hypothetical protein [Falsiroseomonas sp.]